MAVLVVLASELVSYTTAMLAPSNVGFGVRSIEWLRDNGGAWLVSDIERIYYSLNAPEKGGPPLKSLPTVGLQNGGAGIAVCACADRAHDQPPAARRGQMATDGTARQRCPARARHHVPPRSQLSPDGRGGRRDGSLTHFLSALPRPL